MKLRGATTKDASVLLEMRNDPETRASSLQPGIVSAADHGKWLEKTLGNSERLLFIAEDNNEIVGTFRIDKHETGAELSWTIHPKFRGRGYGKKMVVAAAVMYEGELFAKIKSGNKVSRVVAEAAGFKRLSEADGIELWVRN